MSFFKKISWRINFLKNFRKSGYSFRAIFFLLLPSRGRVRNFVIRALFYLTVKKLNGTVKKIKNNYLVEFYEYKFLIPCEVFHWGDFFDIFYREKDRFRFYKKFINDLNFLVSLEGPYEFGDVFLEEGDFVIDAGANIGLFTIMASKRVGLSGKVFSFEPIEFIKSNYLEKNIMLSSCKNVETFSFACGENNEKVKFNINLKTDFEGSSKYIPRKNADVQIVQQKTLDSLVMDGVIPKVDFIKADIEGAERDLLKGSEYTIKKFKPKLAIRTYHLSDDKKVLEEIIKSFVPEYQIIQTEKTLYARIK